MKIKEIKKEVIERVEFVAEDGTVFRSENECRNYEESALFVLKNKVKLISKPHTTHYSIDSEYSDSELEIFQVDTEEDLDLLKRYLYLTIISNGANEVTAKECFECSPERKDYVFANATAGHEIMVFYNYDKDYFWIYGDGSRQGYFDYLNRNIDNALVTTLEDADSE